VRHLGFSYRNDNNRGNSGPEKLRCLERDPNLCADVPLERARLAALFAGLFVGFSLCLRGQHMVVVFSAAFWILSRVYWTWSILLWSLTPSWLVSKSDKYYYYDLSILSGVSDVCAVVLVHKSHGFRRSNCKNLDSSCVRCWLGTSTWFSGYAGCLGHLQQNVRMVWNNLYESGRGHENACV
jgi:hypothetical protein